MGNGEYKKEEIIILSENLVKVDLIDNWWNIQKKCRVIGYVSEYVFEERDW